MLEFGSTVVYMRIMKWNSGDECQCLFIFYGGKMSTAKIFIGTVGEIANHSSACGFSYLDWIY